jgi:hypothetical protein
MMNCGEGVTVAYPLFQEEGGGSIPTSPLQFEIMEIDIHRAQKLNSLWHSRLPIWLALFLAGLVALALAPVAAVFWVVGRMRDD